MNFVIRIRGRLLKQKMLMSVHVDCKCNDDHEDGIVSEGCIRNIVGVFVPDAPTLHFHSLAIILAHCCLHNVLVPLILLQAYECFLCLQANLLGKGVLPIVSLLNPLAPFLAFFIFVLIIIIVLILSLHSCISLLVLTDKVG